MFEILPASIQKKYFQKLANVSIYYIENGYDIKLASFCTQQGDLLAAYEILKYIPTEYHRRIEILEYNGFNINVFLSSFLNSVCALFPFSPALPSVSLPVPDNR